MPALVQTKSRANRNKLFKKFYWHATPNFRCYHGSRLPPKSFEGLWKHSKFYTSKIRKGAPVKIKKKPIPLLAKKLKAEPKKRQKRGILRKTKTAKKQVVLKTVKAKKRVSFGKKAMYGKRLIQEEALYKGRTAYGEKPLFYGSRGDPLDPLKPKMHLDPRSGEYTQVRTGVTAAQRLAGVKGRKVFKPRIAGRRRLLLV